MIFHVSHQPKIFPLHSNPTIPLNDVFSSFQSSPKNGKISKFSQFKENVSPLKRFFSKFLNLCFCCLKMPCLFRKSDLTPEIINPKEYALPILNFFKLLIWTIRVKDAFRNRTVYKSIKKLTDFQAYIIDDLAYIRKKWTNQRTDLSYASCGFLRRLMRGLRKKFKKFLKSFRKITGNIKSYKKNMVFLRGIKTSSKIR